ncbi:MAG TPA: hypothetical protein VG604_00570 [Candidatus Saccharimonadales bacterium]|nr:hypothetical protein [Candidatus Saccharimonadales bacterium]
MSPELVLATIVLIPIVVLLALRVNATLVFLSLCLGDVLLQFVGGDANDLLSLLSASGGQVHVNSTDSLLKIFLLLLPVVLTTIFMIRTVRGNVRLLLNILPAAGVGLLGGLLVVPLLPPGLANNIIGSAMWVQVQRAQDLIVGGSALVCLLVLWMQRPKTGGEEGKHGKKHKG